MRNGEVIPNFMKPSKHKGIENNELISKPIAIINGCQGQ